MKLSNLTKHLNHLWLVLGYIAAVFAVCFTIVLILVLNSTCKDAIFFGKSLRVCRLFDGVGLIIVADPPKQDGEEEGQ